jgi:copper transport protein
MWSSGDRRAVPVLARAALAVAGALLCLTVPGHPAAAHAVLVGSDPPDGATLTQAPRAVELRFGEDVSPRFSSARLVDRDGRPVGGTAAAPGRGGPRRLVLGLPALGAGTYGVLWQVLAEDDGHTTRGVVVFSVGAAGSRARVAPAALGSATSPADVARRWLGLCLLAGLVGALAVALALGLGGPGGSRARPEPEWRVAQQSRAVAPRSTEGLGGSRSGEEGLRRIGGPTPPYEAAIAAARRRLLAFAAACAALGAAAHLADAAVETARQAPATGAGFWTALVRLLTGTRWGQLWLLREAALLALALVLARLSAVLGRRLGRVLATAAGALVLVVVAVEALGSHAAALDSARAVAVTADALHVLTACVWLGMLPALLLLLWPGRGGGASLGGLLRASRRPLTWLAAASVGLVVVTGLYGAGREVDAVDGLVATTYGRALLAKSALLLVAGALGLLNAARLHGWRRPPWLGPPAWRRAAARPPGRPAGGSSGRPSARLVAVEAGVGALLLVAVGLLLESVPARGPAAAPRAGGVAAAAAQTASGTAADLVVTVSVTPNRPGVNGFTVLAASSRRPPPAPLDGVALRLARGGAGGPVALRQVAPGRWFGTGRIDRAGRLRLRAVLRRAGERIAVPLSWQVEPAAPVPLATRAGGRRLAPYVDGVALALLAGAAPLGAARLLVARRRRRRASAEVRPTQPAERVLEGMR